jgi:hypothetical protein
MKHISTPDNLTSFGKNADGSVCITFLDPCYVRSDAIIINRTDLSVHAVLHESSHLVGYIDGKTAGGLVDKADVILSAAHYAGGTVHLKSKISII